MPEQREDRRWVAEKTRIIVRAVVDELCAIAEGALNASSPTSSGDKETKATALNLISKTREFIKGRD